MATKPFSVTINGEQVGRQLKLRGDNITKRAMRAIDQGLKDAAKEIERRGKADIKSAGKFGQRWVDGLKVDVSSGQQRDAGGRFGRVEDRIVISHQEVGFNVHQYGATIRGRPLLWIPFSDSDAEGIRARDYPGALFRVDREGKAPLLMSVEDKEPKYHGQREVKIPKRFHIVEIARDVGSRVRDFVSARVKRDG